MIVRQFGVFSTFHTVTGYNDSPTNGRLFLRRWGCRPVLRSCNVRGVRSVGSRRRVSLFFLRVYVGYPVEVVGVGHPYGNRNRAGHLRGNGGASVVVSTCCGFICPVLRRCFRMANCTFCVKNASKWAKNGRFWANNAPKSCNIAGFRLKFCVF